MAEQVGNRGEALAVYHLAMWSEKLRDDIQYVASGEDRHVYRIGDVVYKIPARLTANPYDHATQERARQFGYGWAPPASSLHEITDPMGGDTVPILAMPYLTDDGTEIDPQALASMHAQTGGQVDRGNYIVRNGQPIVIDCCTVSTAGWPDREER